MLSSSHSARSGTNIKEHKAYADVSDTDEGGAVDLPLVQSYVDIASDTLHSTHSLTLHPIHISKTGNEKAAGSFGSQKQMSITHLE